MSRSGLLKRILWVIAAACVALMFVAVVQSHATPIRPDLKKLLSEPEPKTDFPLARAGWNGPETPPADGSADSTLERRVAGSASRASVAAAAVPDYRAVAGILLVILLLRRIRKPKRPENVTSRAPSPRKNGSMPRAA